MLNEEETLIIHRLRDCLWLCMGFCLNSLNKYLEAEGWCKDARSFLWFRQCQLHFFICSPNPQKTFLIGDRDKSQGHCFLFGCKKCKNVCNLGICSLVCFENTLVQASLSVSSLTLVIPAQQGLLVAYTSCLVHWWLLWLCPCVITSLLFSRRLLSSLSSFSNFCCICSTNDGSETHAPSSLLLPCPHSFKQILDWIWFLK